MSRQTEKFYDWFSNLYPVVELFLQWNKRALLREVNALPPGRLLEIGVGSGAHLPRYRRHEVVGIDTSARMLAIAAKRAGPGLELLQMNGERMTFPDADFDYVVMSYVLAVVDHPERLLEEAHRVLRPNGVLLILNHVTPSNALRHVDAVIRPLARAFRFRSVFYVESLKALSRFRLLKEANFLCSYFKLMIYSKP